MLSVIWSNTIRKDRSCTDQIAALRIIMEQSIGWNSLLDINFIDYEKAFDSVDRTTLWKLLQYYGVPEKIVNIIRNSCDGLNCKIVHGGQLTDSFEVKTGVRQDTTTNIEITNSVAAASAAVGLNIHKGKSKILRYNTACTITITIDGEDLEDVNTFTYLGSIIDEQGGSDADVKARIGKARAAYLQLKNVRNSKQLSTNTKVRIFNTNVKTVLLYGAETCRTTKAIIQKIQVFINNCLCKMLRIRWPDTINNDLLWEKTNQISAKDKIRKKSWKWIGHTSRKAPHCVTVQALAWNPRDQRRSGRPKNTLRRERETDMGTMNNSWIGLER
ncbi:unnamed protein product [Schistosoma curassoni]|uniref:DUF6451 domain-containing protein n=1 Tax=Schistosoma curassoni TaxID=6186 RepID=A0A183K4G8_9TREM|nr:unnamed protein product [Schistosoma curassoni]